MDLSADAIDGITIAVALALALASAGLRYWQVQQLPTGMQFMTDALNGAVVFPLVLLCIGLFWPDVRETITNNNRVLVFLAYLFTGYWALRSIFSRST